MNAGGSWVRSKAGRSKSSSCQVWGGGVFPWSVKPMRFRTTCSCSIFHASNLATAWMAKGQIVQTGSQWWNNMVDLVGFYYNIQCIYGFFHFFIHFFIFCELGNKLVWKMFFVFCFYGQQVDMQRSLVSLLFLLMHSAQLAQLAQTLEMWTSTDSDSWVVIEWIGWWIIHPVRDKRQKAKSKPVKKQVFKTVTTSGLVSETPEEPKAYSL